MIARACCWIVSFSFSRCRTSASAVSRWEYLPRHSCLPATCPGHAILLRFRPALHFDTVYAMHLPLFRTVGASRHFQDLRSAGTCRTDRIYGLTDQVATAHTLFRAAASGDCTTVYLGRASVARAMRHVPLRRSHAGHFREPVLSYAHSSFTLAYVDTHICI